MGKIKDQLILAQEMLEDGYSIDEVAAFTELPYDWIASEWESIYGPIEVG